MGEVHACAVVDLPLAFGYGHSWRHSTELDEPFFCGVGKRENQNSGIQNPESVQEFVLWLCSQPSTRMEGEDRKGTHVF